MEKNYKCCYCEQWTKAKIYRKETEGDDKKNKSKGIKKTCLLNGRDINIDSVSCEYFRPASIIWCQNNEEQINLLVCLNHRLNYRKFNAWRKCKKCRQFKKELQPIVEDYFLRCKKVLELKTERVLKRRKHKEIRKLKCRDKAVKRELKRRPKTRKLKRRK